MYYRYIYLVVVLVVFWFIINYFHPHQVITHTDNLAFLLKATRLPKEMIETIYQTACKYIKSEIPIVETSIKGQSRGRFCIPILYRDLRDRLDSFAEDLSQLISRNGDFKQSILTFVQKNIPEDPESNSCDVILGYDHDLPHGLPHGLWKIYVDNNQGDISCLRINEKDFSVKVKRYRKLSRHQIGILRNQGMIKSHFDQKPKLVYYSDDGSYHIALSSPVKIGDKYLHFYSHGQNMNKMTYYYRIFR